MYFNNLELVSFGNTPQNIKCLKEDFVFLISQKTFEQGYEAVRFMADYLRTKKEIQNKNILTYRYFNKRKCKL